jgi:chemotaxis protein CheD
VSTLLGSCVSACLFDEQAGVGGMNHFILPSSTGELNAVKQGREMTVVRQGSLDAGETELF